MATLTVTIGGVSQTAKVVEGSGTLRFNTFDVTLIDPTTIPANGDAVVLTNPTWSGTVTSVKRRPGPKIGHDYATITATNTSVAGASAGPFGLSDTPNGSTTFGYQDLEVTVTVNLDGTTTTTGKLILFTTGLWPAMTFALTNSDLGYSGTSFSVQEVVVTWVKGVPFYSMTFGDPIVTMAVWLAGVASDDILPITTTKISAGAVTTPKIAANAITTALLATTFSVSGGQVLITPGGIEIDNGVLTFKDTTGSTAMDGSGFGPTWTRFIRAGLFNGDFFAAPPTPASNLATGTNDLPHWDIVSGSHAHITAKWLADAASASGGVVRFTMTSSSTLNETMLLQQLIPLNSSRSQDWNYFVKYTLNRISITGTASSTVTLDWIAADGSTVVGTGASLTGTGGAGLGNFLVRPTAAQAPPATAAYARIRFGVKAATAGDSGTWDAMDVTVYPAVYVVGFADVQAPTTFAPGILWQNNGVFQLVPAALGIGGALQWDGTSLTFPNGDTLTNNASGRMTSSGDFFGNLGIAKTKAGALADGDFNGPAVSGGFGADVTNSRWYVRIGSTWKMVAVAGIGVPGNERRCPRCLRLMRVGERLAPIVNELQEPYVRHALWAHARCGLRWRIAHALGLAPDHTAWYTAALRRVEERFNARHEPELAVIEGRLEEVA